MAEYDIDYIDDLLDAPFKQHNDKTSNNGKIHSAASSGDEGSSSKKLKSKDVDNNVKSHKSSRRSRSKDRKDKKRDEEKSKKSKDKDKDKDRDRKRSRSKERRRKSRSRSRDKRKSRSKSREKERERKRSRSRSRDRRKRSRSKDYDRRRDDDRRRDRDRDRDRRRSRSKDRRRRSYSPRPFRRGRTPPNGIARSGSSDQEDLNPEERAARTIFCMQLAQRIKARDLEEFFSSVGKVTDVRLITCNKTKRFKGIAYVEFKDPESVALALGLSNQRLLGVPIVVQHTQAEKNILPATNNASPEAKTVPSGPMRLYVGSLHFKVNEKDLAKIFGSYGPVDNIQLIKDPETGQSKGYGFITYHDGKDAEEAIAELNGFDLAGRPMKVGYVTERLDLATHASLDTDEMDRNGIDLGATGRLQLMFKLAEKTDMEIPQVTANALMASLPQPEPQAKEEVVEPKASQCFLIMNMFDPVYEAEHGGEDWEEDIRDDVIDELNNHGGAAHVYVDTSSADGKVYVKCVTKATAVLAVNALHGRYFGGRVIQCDYVPMSTYHEIFPSSEKAFQALQPRKKE